ncbi:hypothetical protein R6Q57_026783 [Mikania cordata]
MDKQYSSQTTDKPSKWILSKWRTVKSTDATTSEKPLDNRGKNIFEKKAYQRNIYRSVNGRFPTTSHITGLKMLSSFFMPVIRHFAILRCLLMMKNLTNNCGVLYLDTTIMDTYHQW